MKLLCISALTLAASLCQAEEKSAKPKPPSQLPASVQMEPGAPEVVPGGFTIAIMPDTQFYAQLHPEIFHQQTQWLADNAAKYSLKFVIQVGDVTQTSNDTEWTVARDAFKRFEGKVSWSSAPGNHDYGGKLQTNSHRSPYSTWLPVATFSKMPTYGGNYDKQPDKADNTWHQFEAGGRKWLTIGLEYAPRADVLRWAGEVIAAHPDHSTIIFTHAFLDPRTNDHIKISPAKDKDKTKKKEPEPEPAEKPDITQGEDLWQRVASRHANVVMVLCGHACYTNHRSIKAETGQEVQEMVVDYQSDVNGGNGWMRLLQVLPDGKTVRCQDFSPWINQRCTMPDRTFDFTLAKLQ